MKKIFTLLLSINICSNIFAQDTICISPTIEHHLFSQYLNEDRSYWVGLPLNYSDTINYPVIYVFDAEWRFDLVRNLAFDLGGHNKIEQSIIIGIPHIDWEYQRGIDLTFSHSRVEYDGEKVDSSWYNDANSGGATHFYNYLCRELIPSVDEHYATNGHETLIGHSYGGYFGAYILSLDHPFEVIHIYDPSIWYSNGEVVKRLQHTSYTKITRIHLTYQPEPAFHRNKIEELIEALRKIKSITLTTAFYESETHYSLFLDSFYRGIVMTNK